MTTLESIALRLAREWYQASISEREAFLRAIDEGWAEQGSRIFDAAEVPKPTLKTFYGPQSN
jgi:hypothetical protein